MSATEARSTTRRVYRLYLGLYLKVLLPLLLGGFTVLGIVWLIPGLVSGGPPFPFPIVWLGALAYMWIFLLSVPYRIEVDEAGRVTFVSRLRRIQVASGAIRSIRPRPLHIGFLVVRHDGGRILLLSQFDGFHEFLTELTARSPGVELRGC